MNNKISFKVNGNEVESTLPQHARLSKVLRDELNLEGTKVGCDAGDCGACSVLIDGELVCACLTAVSQVEGKHVETVEGLAANDTLHGLQESFLKLGAAQCGICTPGMLMSAVALLKHNEKPSREDVEYALGGVLCRCTGYTKIIDAVLDASGSGEIQSVTSSNGVENCEVGRALPRIDGEAKVRGDEKFGADNWPENTLLLRVIRSPFHHAKFTLGDVDNFLSSNPEIYKVFSVKDVVGDNFHGVIPGFEDQPVFADKITRYKGEAIAAIVGEREAVENFNNEIFPVSWEELPAHILPLDGLRKDAVQLHENMPNNILTKGYVECGDVENNISNSDYLVEVNSKTPFIEHGYIEPEAGYAIRKNDRIEIHGCTQTAFMNRFSIAKFMGINEENVRINPSACGGGFGSKIDLSYQPLIALAAWQMDRPVAVCYTRNESIQSTTKRHPSEIKLRLSADKNGKINALDFEGIFNTGSYASWGPTVASRVPVHASGPYCIKNYRANSLAVFTHTAPSGAFRGFGVPQSAVAQECAFDLMAEKIGMDPLEFRKLNALENGVPTVTGQIFDSGVGIKDCLDALTQPWQEAAERAKAWNDNSKNQGIRYGYGLGTCWYGCGNTGMSNPSTIRIGIKKDGRVVLHQGAIDIGQGANTVITQIAADAIGITIDAFDLIGADSDVTPDAGKTSASRQTFISGNAARISGEALRTEILRHANVSKDAKISFDENAILLQDGENQQRLDLKSLKTNDFGYVFMSEESYDPPTKPLDEKGQGEPYAVYGYGAQLMELLVDEALGTVKLLRLTTAHDVGKAINPLLVEGQIEGGSAQGIGLALMEEFLPGRTENLHDYLIPTMGDMPEFKHHLVEVADPHGPYGAKGLGEHVLIPTAPAILNAIYKACGAQVYDLPATPDKVLAAIKRSKKLTKKI